MIYTSNKVEQKVDIWAARLFISVVIIKGANLTFQCTDILPGIVEKGLFLIIAAFFLWSLAVNVNCTIRKSKVAVLLFFLLFSLMYLWAYINYPEIQANIIKRFIWTVFLGTPCFASLCSLENPELFFKELYRFSYIITIFGTLIYIGDTGILSSNMAFSAMMLFPFSIHIAYLGTASKKLHLYLICLFELFIIFMHGSRGSFFFSIIFVILYFGIKNGRSYKKIKKFSVFLLIIIFATLMLLLNAEKIMIILEEHGIYVRNLDFLSRGVFISRSGRSEIYDEYVYEIVNSLPIRFRIVDLLNNGTNYPHNIFIEILYDFGYFLGTVLIVIFMYTLITRIFKSQGNHFNILMILTCAGLFPLMTSFTYLEWPTFWALLGYLSRYINLRKKKELTERYSQGDKCSFCS